jgi:ATP-dependent helicase/nuclease subunit A
MITASCANGRRMRNAPTHFSAFGRKAERGIARDHAVRRKKSSLKEQEDWNLLYVAATRARNLLIVSGVADARSGSPMAWRKGAGMHGSAMSNSRATARKSLEEMEAGSRRLRNFRCRCSIRLLCRLQMSTASVFSSAEIEEGIALHALMERLTQAAGLAGRSAPATTQMAKWLSCTPETADIVCAQAGAILSNPELARFFDPALHRFARNEMEIISRCR